MVGEATGQVRTFTETVVRPPSVWSFSCENVTVCDVRLTSDITATSSIVSRTGNMPPDCAGSVVTAFTSQLIVRPRLRERRHGERRE